MMDVSNDTADPDFTTVCAVDVLENSVPLQVRMGSIIATKAL